jgi:hypothetical protein
MLEIVIPGDTTLGLQHLVLDYLGVTSLFADMTYEGARFAVPLLIGILTYDRK